jgi:two-component system, NarL family, nitrate/nitrite response regulator NarL
MRRLFDTAPFNVLMEARHTAELLPALKEKGIKSAFVLIEWFPDEPDLVRELEELKESGDFTIVALSDQMDSEALVSALRAGVQAFLLRDMSPESLIQSLMLVKTGEVVFPTELAAHLISSIKRHVPAFDLSDMSRFGLSEREMQILRCLVEGQPNKVIANNLNLAEGTVKVHLKALLRKINAANRTQAAIWALNHGMKMAAEHEHELH